MEYPLSMPGSFLPADHDHPVHPTLTIASATSSIFPPPQTPSASSTLSRSIRSGPRTVSASSNGSLSRKRPRLDTATFSSYDVVPTKLRDDYGRESDASLLSDYPGTMSPSPLVNSDYLISGGLDTPTADSAYLWEKENVAEVEKDYRPNRFSLDTQPHRDSYFAQMPAPLRREGNGHKRAHSTYEGLNWRLGKTVWACTGGFAGKVISLCWSSAFRGFHAGEGTGYNMNDGMNALSPSTTSWVPWVRPEGDEKDVFHANYRVRGSIPVPGEFPKESFIPDYMSRPQDYQNADSQTPTQCNDGAGRSIMGHNWVMINENDAQSRTPSPVRKKPRPNTTTFDQERPGSRTSMAGMPRLPPSRPSLTNASFASTRANGSHNHNHNNQRPSLSHPSTLSDSPSQNVHLHGHRRSRSSLASPRRSNINSAPTVPLSPVVSKYSKKVRRQEKEQDESIRRLNQQLKDMIREGKQALGTKIEVLSYCEDDTDDDTTAVEIGPNSDVDEGYEEGESLDEERGVEEVVRHMGDAGWRRRSMWA